MMKNLILEILDELDFYRVSDKPEETLADLVTKSLKKRFGEQTIKAILEEASSYYKKPYEEILLNPEIFFKAFQQIFGAPATKVISRTLEKDLEQQGISVPSDRLIDTMLNEISKKDVIRFIENLQGEEHILYFWSGQKSRDEILSEYFTSSDGSKLLIGNNPSNLVDVKNITFDELLKDKSQITTKFRELVTKAIASNKSGSGTRCAGNDCSLWFKHDTYKELLAVENMINEFQENHSLSFMCAYKKNKTLPNEKLREITDFHNYVILENPLRIYKK